jgi:hypothetical protein
MRESFVFLPLDVTCPEGWRIASELDFSKMPLIAFIRPRGTTVDESRIVVTFEGPVGQNPLLRVMISEARHVRRESEESDQAADSGSVGDEDARAIVQAEFDALPVAPPGSDIATVRFRFPDRSVQVHNFLRDEPIAHLFVFARKFMWPREFALLTGAPPVRLEDCTVPLNDVIGERTFIVEVDNEGE